MSQGFVNKSGITLPLALSEGGTGKSSSLEYVNKIKVTRFTSGSGTFTPDANCVFAEIELQGAGGGSGGSTGAAGESALPGAGGGGGYLKFIATKAQLTAGSVSYAVGAAGTAGASGVNGGGNGGNTTFTINSGTAWTAFGGTGGTGQASSASAQQQAGNGAGGGITQGTNGTLILENSGRRGELGHTVASGGIVGRNFGSGGIATLGLYSQYPGETSLNYGAGAIGSYNVTGSNQPGLAGAPGVIIITEFLSAES